MMVFATVLEASIPEITGQIVDTLFAVERSSDTALTYSLALFVIASKMNNLPSEEIKI